MKQLISILILIQCMFLISCTSDDDAELIIKISDEYNITGNDIEFYDSSTCILFLKEKIRLQYILTDSIYNGLEDFSIYINDDFIYNGIFFPAYSSMIPPLPSYIACYTNDSINTEFLHFNFVDFPSGSVDDRNDNRLMDFYKINNLLRNGISCTIENIVRSSINDSILNIELSMKNNDNISYLIPELSIISPDQFYMLSGGFIVKKHGSENNIPQKLDNYILDKTIMSLDNLVVIKGMDKKTFFTTAKYETALEGGSYKCVLYFGNVSYYSSFSNFKLNQDNGRVWIGEAKAITDFEIE